MRPKALIQSLLVFSFCHLPAVQAVETAAQASIYVVGDSISTPGAWPRNLETLTGRPVFSQAIGGTTSPSMVARARGVELIAPETTPTEPGIIRMKWSRHIADRTQAPSYRQQWAGYAKSVSEPTRIEIYQNGHSLGLAKPSLKTFTTDHATQPKVVRCPGHGLAEGERVVFISNDPAYPADLTCSGDMAPWSFSSGNLPAAIIERRVYFAAHVTPDTFEIKELKKDAATMDLGSDAKGAPSVECGWTFDVDYKGGPWDVTWTTRTKYDHLVWLLEVSANDIPILPAEEVTIPNTQLLLQQMTDPEPRYILVYPPAGSFANRGPGTFAWTNYYDTYMPWVRKNHPANHLDTMAVLNARRSARELEMLVDLKTPRHLWIKGVPGDESTWEAFDQATPDAFETWIGPGYTPLHFRAGFNDGIHLNNKGNQLLAEEVATMLKAKNW